jgi:hypothetical protein
VQPGNRQTLCLVESRRIADFNKGHRWLVLMVPCSRAI